MTPEFSVRVLDTRQGAVLDVHVQARAKRTAILGILENRLKLAVASPAIEGRANAEMLRFLAEIFSVPRAAVVILGGEHSRNKRVLISQQKSGQIASAIECILAGRAARDAEGG